MTSGFKNVLNIFRYQELRVHSTVAHGHPTQRFSGDPNAKVTYLGAFNHKMMMVYEEDREGLLRVGAVCRPEAVNAHLWVKRYEPLVKTKTHSNQNDTCDDHDGNFRVQGQVCCTVTVPTFPSSVAL